MGEASFTRVYLTGLTVLHEHGYTLVLKFTNMGYIMSGELHEGRALWWN
jgi:hypothetical protein